MPGTFNVRTGVFTPKRAAAPKRKRAKRPLSDDELLTAAVADGRILARAGRTTRGRWPPTAWAPAASWPRWPGSPLTDAERERLAAYVGDGTSTDGAWMTPHRRSVPGTVYGIDGRPVAAVPAAPSPPAPRRASADDDGWTPPSKPPKLCPGTILDESGRVVASA
jgi:hypothetical protein